MAAYSLEDRRVLITGASSGIGWSLAERFAIERARLVLVARRRERLERLADKIETQGGLAPIVRAADLSVRGNAAELATSVNEDLGGIDVLVNNAGSAVGGVRSGGGGRPGGRRGL